MKKDGTVSASEIDKGSVYFQQRFVVDRVTAHVRGSLFTNEGAEQITILDNGKNPENAFSVFWTGRKVVSAPYWYLRVESFIRPKSPFILFDGSGGVSGLCN